MITLLISGGQTGADQGGLRAAKKLGIKTSGTAPKHYTTEVGPAPWLFTEFKLFEDDNEYDYAPRTRKNVEDSDATVIFGKRSRGSNLTERLCKELGKPMLWIQYPDERVQMAETKFRLWLARTNPTILNVAGNRESVSPGIGRAVELFLTRALV